MAIMRYTIVGSLSSWSLKCRRGALVLLKHQAGDADAAVAEAQIADLKDKLNLRNRQIQEFLRDRDEIAQWGFDWQARANEFGEQLSKRSTHTNQNTKQEELVRKNEELLGESSRSRRNWKLRTSK